MRIYDLSWNKKTFLAKVQLFFRSRKREREKIKSTNRQVQAQGYSTLSSTYYSIVGTAFSQFKEILRPKWLAPVRVVMWSFTWCPLATWCYWRMLPLSNHVIEILGYEGMSADQCNVRQSILRQQGRYTEARKCINVGINKNPEKAHTRGLLHVGLAEILWCKDWKSKEDKVINWVNVETEVDKAFTEVKESEKEDSLQAMRLYHHCADLIDSLEGEYPCQAMQLYYHCVEIIYYLKRKDLSGSQLREKAQTLAKEADARDQLSKS